jgi:ribosomal protein S18 acetylase RimI-like enzyme
VTVRAAQRDDAAGIAAAHVASWRETYVSSVSHSLIERNTEERRRALWERVLAEAARDVFVAVDGATIVGFVCGGAMPDSIRGRAPIPDHDAYVDALYVVAAQHRRGVGRALLGTLARRLCGRGFHSLALHVAAQNPARRFYERLGARFLYAEAVCADADEGVQAAYGWTDIARVPTGTSVDGSTAGR